MITHWCCSSAMADVTEPADLRAGYRVWLCLSGCGREIRERVAAATQEQFCPPGEVEAALAALQRGDRLIAQHEPPTGPAAGQPPESPAQREERLALAAHLEGVLRRELEAASAGVGRLSVPCLRELAERYAHRKGYADGGPPEEHTEALPASPEKIAVLTARRRAGRSLHHPRDPGAKRAARMYRQLVAMQAEAKAGILAEIHRRLAERGRGHAD